MKDNEGKKYDLIAADFAKMRDSFSTEKKYIDLFLSYLKPSSHVLDVGCGSGYPIASYLIEHGLQVTGIDASKKLLKIAKKNCPTMTCVYGDIRYISLDSKYDGIVEWWCLFHLPKADHPKMIARFASWLKYGGILEFSTCESECEEKSSDMLDQELCFYSLDAKDYEKHLKANGFKILLRENHQEQQLVWIAKYEP
jgi:2-polyprenyl-3-methyl-5-hydroxy-6-metoxy-1,4-benzoquinol methylase